MSNRKMMNKTGIARLRNDYLRIKQDPVPFIEAEPQPSNILIWHYVVKGPEDSLYAGGYYHGKIIFPSEFPFKPPSIIMLTPNGRFNVNSRLCLSMSDYHPDTWNPAWSVSTILTGLLSFMLETSPTTGSVETTATKKKLLAIASGEFNLRDKDFCELFPPIVEEIKKQQEKRRLDLINSTNSVKRRGNALTNHSTESEESTAPYKLLTNVIFLTGLALFAYAVKLVVGCVAEEV